MKHVRLSNSYLMNVLIIAFILAFNASNKIFAQENIYVSFSAAELGDGTKESPYKTINEALRNRVDRITSDTLYIHLAEGDYYLERPVLFNESTSRPILIRTQGESKANLIGGKKVEGWEKYNDKIYRAFIPEVLQYNFKFEQLFVNGKRAILARTPNKEWNYVKSSKEESFAPGLRYPEYAVQQIYLESKDILSLGDISHQELQNVKVKFNHKWDVTQKYIDYLNVDSGFICTRGEGMHPWNIIGEGSTYILYNYFEALDSPGEWFLDREDGYLYYMPKEGEDINTSTIIVPTLENLLIVKGEKDSPIKNITFDNISFKYTSYLLPPKGNGPEQAAASTSAALMFDFVENITLVNCEILHTGAYAVWFRQECNNNTIQKNYIADMGAGGIKIGSPYIYFDKRTVTHNNIIDNNIITHGGSELPAGIGIALFHTSDNKVTHNEISDIRYSGISVGWVWGYNDEPNWSNTIDDRGVVDFVQTSLSSPSARNIIEYNHIHHIGWGELSDMGAVYTLGESEGTRVSHNVIHDILSYDYGGWGLYTDEGSTGVEMTSNLVYRCKSGGFHQHYGKDNKIENNIFAFGHHYQAQYTRVEPHLSFSFKHNIIIQDKGTTLQGPWDKGNLEIDENMYWHTSGSPSFPEETKEWLKTREPHSVIADPMFVDARNDDFNFKSKKNIKKIKFKLFDYSKAGVYGDNEWKSRAELSSDIIKEFDDRAAIIHERK